MSESLSTKSTQLLLAVGARVFRSLSQNDSSQSSDDLIHVLNDDEQEQLKRIERAAIFRGALIGTLTAIICAFSWSAGVALFGDVAADASIRSSWRQYSVMFGMFTIATIIEIALLYWNTLVAVHRMALAAGLRLFDSSGQPKEVMKALVGAALELPNTRQETWFARPGHEVSRWWVVIATLLYRLKVTITYYIAKTLVQRFLGRVLVRWAIELVAIPVYAIWDALVTYWVLRQAKVCAMGPSAIEAICDHFRERARSISELGRLTALCGVGCTVARNPYLHPNVQRLLNQLVTIFGLPTEKHLDDSGTLLDYLPRLEADEQRFVLELISLAVVLDGRASIWERELIQSCLLASNLPADTSGLNRELKRFRNGQGIRLEQLVIQA